MLHCLRRFAVISSERTVDKVKKGYLVQSYYFPAPLETAQINRPQFRVSRIAQQRVIAKESQLIVPRRDLVGRKCQPLADRISLVMPLQKLIQPLLEFFVTRHREGGVHVSLRLHAIESARLKSIRA